MGDDKNKRLNQVDESVAKLKHIVTLQDPSILNRRIHCVEETTISPLELASQSH